MKMEASVSAVEKIIGYTFQNKKLLEQALTHTSYPEAVSYERLEFVGDAVLGLAISNHLFLAYSSVDPGQLSLLRAANVSTEKLARAAVRNGLHRYVRHNTLSIVDMINEFVDAVGCEDDCALVMYGGSVKAPKILADIVESVAAAVYVDVDFDLKKLWVNPPSPPLPSPPSPPPNGKPLLPIPENPPKVFSSFKPASPAGTFLALVATRARAKTTKMHHLLISLTQKYTKTTNRILLLYRRRRRCSWVVE